MKKVILSFFILLNITSLAVADVMPYYVNSLRRNGIGFTQVTSPLVLRRTPSSDGEILDTFHFDYKGNTACAVNKEKCSNIDEIFAAYSESKKLAFLTTLDETQGWNMVCFNQNEAPVCGWVENKTNRYYTLLEFFETFGKKYGLYLFKDLQKADKVLYAGPMKQTNSTGSIEMPKAIMPWLIKGNWTLVKVHDFNNSQKTGWINFRGDNGKLRLFVKF